MREDLINFDEGVTVERRRELLAKRITEKEAERAAQQEVIDKAKRAFKSAETKLRNAQDGGNVLDREISNGVEQLLTLLPGVVEGVPIQGLYHFRGQELWGNLHFEKKVTVVPPGQAHLPQEAREDIEVEQFRG